MTRMQWCTLALSAALMPALSHAQPTGACCFPTGNCTVTKQVECELAGCYVGDGTTCNVPCPKHINVSGATLFKDFFTKEASTNDYINADGDTYLQCNDFYYDGFQWVCVPKSCVTAPFAKFDPCKGFPPTDQLALTYCDQTDPCGRGSYWLVNYRGVGSGNGLAEMRDFTLIGNLPSGRPAEGGWINRKQYADTTGCLPTGCGQCGTSCSPVCQFSIDLAVMDVPTSWFVTQDGTPSWGRRPGQPGYGNNPLRSYCCCLGNESNKLKSLCNGSLCLNLNTADPDAYTVFDTEIAWVPISFVANPGVFAASSCPCPGRSYVRASELQYLYTTGRMPSGENLVAATRDAGSGTRNGGMNSICVDPSWGRGDNCGKKHENGKYTLVGPHFQASNCGGSGIMEDVVKNCRLAIGYTGLAGSSRAVGDAQAGRYEILDLVNDHMGGTQPVRPTINAVLHPAPNTGWAIGGPETFASVGDPNETNPNSPAYIANQAAADYLRNIVTSINEFILNPTASDSTGMPGQLLARDYFLVQGLDYLIGPCGELSANPNFNPTLQDYIAANNGLGIGSDCPPFGAYAYKYPTPVRAKAGDYQLPEFDPPGLVWPASTCDCPYPPDGFYSDGGDGSYYKDINGSNVPSILGQRNWVAGDFNGDGCRNLNDIPAMMAAIYDRYVLNPATYGYPWTTYRPLSGGDGTVCVDIIGDFNSDGNFDCRDVRYFCDGLAISTTDCKLRRWDAFLAVDQAWLTLTGTDSNYFNTTIYDCSNNPRPWVMGASAADIAGGTCVAPGARPCGHDGRVDCQDMRYADGKFGQWADIDDAVTMDLSCDVTNNLIVDCDDLAVYETLLGCRCPGLTHECLTWCLGDMNCSGGAPTFDDIKYFSASVGTESGWWAYFVAKQGFDPPCPWLLGDFVAPYGVEFNDIKPFANSIGKPCIQYVP